MALWWAHLLGPGDTPTPPSAASTHLPATALTHAARGTHAHTGSWVALGAAGRVGCPGEGGAPGGGESTAPSCVWRVEAERAQAHLSWWITRLMASKSTAFLALECCTFLDLGGSWALLRIASRHSVRRPRTAGSSGQNRQPLAAPCGPPCPSPSNPRLSLSEGEGPNSNPEAA